MQICVLGDHQNITWGKRNHDDVIKWKHFPRYWPFHKVSIMSSSDIYEMGPNIHQILTTWIRLYRVLHSWWFCLAWRQPCFFVSSNQHVSNNTSVVQFHFKSQWSIKWCIVREHNIVFYWRIYVQWIIDRESICQWVGQHGRLLPKTFFIIYHWTNYCWWQDISGTNAERSITVVMAQCMYLWNKIPVVGKIYASGSYLLGPLLLTWFNFNPNMDK